MINSYKSPQKRREELSLWWWWDLLQDKMSQSIIIDSMYRQANREAELGRWTTGSSEENDTPSFVGPWTKLIIALRVRADGSRARQAFLFQRHHK